MGCYCSSNSSYGPTFGGHDLTLDCAASGGTYVNFPVSYTDTLGRGKATFTGAQKFTPEDYEVWAVN
jgi:hypothetical protein